jgi:peptide/nickel transport system substrate-binding protein
VGIRAKLRPLECAAFLGGNLNKKFKNIIQDGNAALGNPATRIEAFVVGGGAQAYRSYPDIDALYQEQAVELDREKRAATLGKIQRLVHERAIYVPIFQFSVLEGVGRRVRESGFGRIAGFVYTAPYEDITIKGT